MLALNTALDRMSCTYSLGFRDDDLRESRRMPLSVTLRTKGLRAVHAAYYVRRTEEMKRESRLSAAFVDPASADDGSVGALFIPRGGDGKSWKADLQVRMRPTGIPDNTAVLGASVVRRDKVTDQFASSIAMKSGSRAVVLEKSLDIAPGKFLVVAVGHDVKRDKVGSRRLEVEWPDLAGSVASVAPIAALQSGPAVISKNDDVMMSGAVARAVEEPLDKSSGVSLVSVVCRGVKTKGPVVIERSLDGGSIDEFAPLTIADSDEPCRQTVDAINAGRLGPDGVEFRVVARVGGEIAAEARRFLRVGGTP